MVSIPKILLYVRFRELTSIVLGTLRNLLQLSTRLINQKPTYLTMTELHTVPKKLNSRLRS